MNAGLSLVALLALAVTAVCTQVLTGYARKMSIVDTPNQRSSHKTPTPRGGGVAIVATSTLGFLGAAGLGFLEYQLALALVVGGLTVAIVGFIDDRRTVPSWARLVVHLGAASWAVFVLDGTPILQLGAQIVTLDGPWLLFNVLAIVWVLNLFNFMDGIDGIAASQAIFVCLAGAVLGILAGTSTVAIAAVILAGSSLGFLFWNWSPAKIFMGDAGSGYLGYIIAVLALAAAFDSPVQIMVWLVLGGVFFVDATVTLTRRLIRGERVYEAHRSHAYQWLARRWDSHQRVTLAVVAINVALLLPLAVWCTLQPERAYFVVAGAIAVLFVLMLCAGAGRTERDNLGDPVIEPPGKS